MERLFRLDHHPKIPEGRRLQVFQVSDIHLGSKTHLHDPFLEMIKKIRKTRFTAAILHGDLLENNNKGSVGEGVYEQLMTPDEQLEELYHILKPIRGKILGISRGNHETRTSKSEGIDLINVLCTQLEVPRLLSHSLHTFHFDANSHTLLVCHGKTGAATRAGKMRAVEKLAKIYDADAYLYGHVHDLLTWMDLKYTSHGNKIVRYGINGSFMGYLDSYAQEGEYTPGVPGYITSMIGRDGIELVPNIIPMDGFFMEASK